MGEGRSGATRGAYFYAQGSLIYKLLGDGELGWGTIRVFFYIFFKKNKDWEEKLRTLGDALTREQFWSD